MPRRIRPSKTATAMAALLATAAIAVGPAPASRAQTDTPSISAANVPAATNPPGPGLPTPQVYARTALDFIEQTAYRVPSVDWPAIRSRADALAAKAVTIADTYPIIAGALSALNDHHSSFTKPVQAVEQTSGRYNGFGFLAVWPTRLVVTVAAGSPAAVAGLVVGDRIDAVDGKTPPHSGTTITIPRDRNGDFPARITLTVKRKNRTKPLTIVVKVGEVTLISVPQTVPVPLTLVSPDLAYLEVPGIVGDATAQQVYATQLQAAIRESDQARTRCGWIVDLRRNRGGYIFAMLAGLGPLLGNGVLGGKRDAAGHVATWSYDNGALLEGGVRTVVADSPYTPTHPAPPVAVLVSGLSASAAEATTIAFRGRPDTRSFGEATLGLTSFNTRRTMPDGAFLDVMTNVDVDRNGHAYDGPVPVDEPVKVDWANIGNDHDPVLAAAVHWLDAQPACTGP